MAAGGARSDSSSGRSILQKLDMSLEKIVLKAALPGSYKSGGRDTKTALPKKGDPSEVEKEEEKKFGRFTSILSVIIKLTEKESWENLMCEYGRVGGSIL